MTPVYKVVLFITITDGHLTALNGPQMQHRDNVFQKSKVLTDPLRPATFESFGGILRVF